MTSKKAIRSHYNKILKDPELRNTHFEASGALGNEHEGRSLMERMETDRHNQKVRMAVRNESPDEKLRRLKENGKIVL